jgi:hypothetical protein
VWGTKFAFASVRSAMPGLRVITGLRHIPDSLGGGEVAAFTTLALAAADRLPGVTAFVVDGALRGTAINTIQTQTGAIVVSPPRPKDLQHGGIMIAGKAHAYRILPESKSRIKAFSKCGGHNLWAAAGGIHERIVTGDGSVHYEAVTRGQQKRERHRDGTWAFYARHRLTCPETGEIHQWWEPLTATRGDDEVKFNRAEYLRAIPRDDPEYSRVYPMRADTESLHAQLEYAFHKNRLPAWGIQRQTLVILFAAMAQNAWALHVWQRETARQQAPPGNVA